MPQSKRPTVRVHGPDGKIVHFPMAMSPKAIEDALRTMYPTERVGPVPTLPSRVAPPRPEALFAPISPPIPEPRYAEEIAGGEDPFTSAFPRLSTFGKELTRRTANLLSPMASPAGAVLAGAAGMSPKLAQLAGVSLGVPAYIRGMERFRETATPEKPWGAWEEWVPEAGLGAAMMLPGLGKATKKPGKAGSERGAIGGDDAVLRILRALSDEPGALHSITKMRQSMSDIPKDVFDRVIFDLAESGYVALHRHHFPAGLSQAERAMMPSMPAVAKQRGEPPVDYYIGATIRDPEKLGGLLRKLRGEVGSTRNRILRAIEEADPSRSGNYETVDVIRKSAGNPPDFDEVALRLAKEGKLVLGSYGGMMPIPRERHHEYIFWHPEKRPYMAIARPREEGNIPPPPSTEVAKSPPAYKIGAPVFGDTTWKVYRGYDVITEFATRKEAERYVRQLKRSESSEGGFVEPELLGVPREVKQTPEAEASQPPPSGQTQTIAVGPRRNLGPSSRYWDAAVQAVKELDYLGFDSATQALSGVLREGPNWQEALRLSPDESKIAEPINTWAWAKGAEGKPLNNWEVLQLWWKALQATKHRHGTAERVKPEQIAE